MGDDELKPPGLLGDLFSKLQAAQADLAAQEEAVERTVVEGRAAGGSVVVSLRGSLEADAVRIAPAVIDPADPSLLEDAVLAALRDALGQLRLLRSSLLPDAASSAGGMDLAAVVGDLDLGGLLGGVDLSGLMGGFGLGLEPGEQEEPEEPGSGEEQAD